MPTIDEEIARHLREALASGELSSTQSWGKPLPEDAGRDATPEALRMPLKILRDAGFAPPEIELFHERARLRSLIGGATDLDEQRDLRQRPLRAGTEARVATRSAARQCKPLRAR